MIEERRRVRCHLVFRLDEELLEIVPLVKRRGAKLTP